MGYLDDSKSDMGTASNPNDCGARFAGIAFAPALTGENPGGLGRFLSKSASSCRLCCCCCCCRYWLLLLSFFLEKALMEASEGTRRPRARFSPSMAMAESEVESGFEFDSEVEVGSAQRMW